MTIALVMIVRDEARCIERCLASVRPWVDSMIVLDTGSRDATPELAAAAGAQVHRFRWCDDFSAARNAALAHSDADWNLVLDADEWLRDGGANLRAQPSPDAGFVGTVDIVNEFDTSHGPQTSRSVLPRLLPRGVRYAGRIHEQPDTGLPRMPVGLTVAHDGYRGDALAAKRGRNLRLLEDVVAAAPHDPYLRYQLGKDLCVYERFEDAVPHLLHALDDAAPGARYRHDLVVRTIFALKKCHRHADAVQIAEHEMRHWQGSPDFHFALGDLLLDWAACEPARATELLPMIEAAWLQCLHIGEQPGFEGSVAGRGSHLAAGNLAVLYDGTGRPDEARRFRAMATAPATR